MSAHNFPAIPLLLQRPTTNKRPTMSARYSDPKPQFYEKLESCSIIPCPVGNTGKECNEESGLHDSPYPRTPYGRTVERNQIQEIFYYSHSRGTMWVREYHHIVSPGPLDTKDACGEVVKVPGYLSLLISFTNTELKRDCPKTRSIILHDIYESLKTNSWSEGFCGNRWLLLVFNELNDEFQTDKESAIFLADCGHELGSLDTHISFYRACAILLHTYKVQKGILPVYSGTNPSWLDAFQSMATRDLVIEFESMKMSMFYRSINETGHMKSFKEYVKEHMATKSTSDGQRQKTIVNPYKRKRSVHELK